MSLKATSSCLTVLSKDSCVGLLWNQLRRIRKPIPINPRRKNNEYSVKASNLTLFLYKDVIISIIRIVNYIGLKGRLNG